jgi:bacteriorhodopsin
MFFTSEGALALLAAFLVAAFAPRRLAALGAAAAVVLLVGMAIESGPYRWAFWPVAVVGTFWVVFMATAPRKVGAR